MKIYIEGVENGIVLKNHSYQGHQWCFNDPKELGDFVMDMAAKHLASKDAEFKGGGVSTSSDMLDVKITSHDLVK